MKNKTRAPAKRNAGDGRYQSLGYRPESGRCMDDYVQLTCKISLF